MREGKLHLGTCRCRVFWGVSNELLSLVSKRMGKTGGGGKVSDAYLTFVGPLSFHFIHF